MTDIVKQAKRLSALLDEFNDIEYSPEDRAKVAFLIGARLLSIEGELRSIGQHIDPGWCDEGGLAWNLRRANAV